MEESMGMDHSTGKSMSMGMNHYRGLLIMTVLSFISMFVLMYSMVDSLGNVLISLNQVYMAGLMTAPMVIIELLLMKGGKAPLQSAEIKELCRNIIVNQRAEIAQMKALLAR